MDRKTTAIALGWGLITILGTIAPYASASGPSCSTVTDAAIGISGIYIFGTQIWLENNGAPGLQRVACVRDTDHVAVGPDTFVIGLPVAVPPLP